MISVETIETSSLGDRSYLATDGEVAVVVDPQRDIDRVLRLVEERDVRVTHVLETHVHNDYVTGGLELAGVTGAHYVLGAGSGVSFDHLPVADGDVIEAGRMRLRAVHTPGHTHQHVSYELGSVDGPILGVFTGGSMLFGATGRTDLVAPEDTEGLTRDQFHSVRRLAQEVPPEAQVYPTHGFGSFCSATPTSGDSSTIGEQLRVNPALTQEEQEYVDTLLAGLDAYPAYYVRMAPLNRQGPPPVDLSMPELVDGDELRRRIDAGEWVVDLRQRTAFAAGHLERTRNVEFGDSFVTYLGWLYTWGAPLTLIGESQQQVADARRQLVRIGIDELSGAAVGDIASLADGRPLRSYGVSDFAGLADRLEQQDGDVSVLDTRRNDERAAGGVRGSLHVPIHELADRLEEVPDGEVWVYCASGYRASVAASIIDRPGRRVVLVDDDFEKARPLGLLAEPATASTTSTP